MTTLELFPWPEALEGKLTFGDSRLDDQFTETVAGRNSVYAQSLT
jgi:hypothetical protein